MKTQIFNIALILVFIISSLTGNASNNSDFSLALNEAKKFTPGNENRLNLEISTFPNHDALSSIIGVFDFSYSLGGSCFLCWGSGGSPSEPPYRIESFRLAKLNQFGINYQHFINDEFGFNYGFQFGQFRKNIYTNDVIWGKRVTSFYTIHQDVIYRLINNKNFELYSLVGIAGTYTHAQNNLSANNPDMPDIPKDIEDEYNLNFQITPLGIRVGNSFAVKAEVGVGYKGGINIGISKQFN